jgi:polysaccharide deacetylase family protein (PEP-CTERM system associated)
MTLPIRNAMTVDVEEHFQVQAFAHCIARDGWERIASRVEGNVDRILEQFASMGITATFFTLGWIAERHKPMVRRIVAAGHELASHGYDHTRADAQDPASFGDDISSTRQMLEDIGGVGVHGYRAATFSIGARNQWAYRVLAKAGYRYSSSVNPIRHDLYGMPHASREPYQPDNVSVWEFPVTTVRACGHNWPCSGGGYFRLLPYDMFRRGLRHVNRHEQRSGIFYFHPWEIDPDQPRIPDCGWKPRIRHYTNLSRMTGRLDRLLHDFSWGRMDRVFADVLNSSDRTGPPCDQSDRRPCPTKSCRFG